MWAKMIRWVSAVFIVIFTVTIVLQLGPLVETSLFPVVSKAQLTSIVPTADGKGSVIQVQFTRLRNCEYLGLAWYQLTMEGGAVRVPISIGQPLQPAIKQVVTSGPWVIPIPPSQLHDHSYAVVFHRCHVLWLSTTNFYP